MRHGGRYDVPHQITGVSRRKSLTIPECIVFIVAVNGRVHQDFCRKKRRKKRFPCIMRENRSVEASNKEKHDVANHTEAVGHRDRSGIHPEYEKRHALSYTTHTLQSGSGA